MGLAFNLSDNIGRTQAVINRYRAPFQDSRVVLFENDSTDGTREHLKAWSETDPSVHILDCCDEGSCECKLKGYTGYDGGFRSQSRIERMAGYRNRCLDWARKHCADYEYALVLDLDLQGACTENAMELALGVKDETRWDSIHPDARMPLYGSFGTLTHSYDGLSFLPTPKALAKFDADSVSMSRLIARWFRMNSKLLQRDRAVRVGALFNGFGLYDFQLMRRSKYVGKTCEHIWLQGGMQKAVGRDLRVFLLKLWRSHVGFQGPQPWMKH